MPIELVILLCGFMFFAGRAYEHNIYIDKIRIIAQSTVIPEECSHCVYNPPNQFCDECDAMKKAVANHDVPRT